MSAAAILGTEQLIEAFAHLAEAGQIEAGAREAAGAAKAADAARDAARTAALGKASGDASKAVSTLGTTVMNTNSTMNKYSSSVSGAADALGGLAMMLKGPLMAIGVPLALLAKAISISTDLVLKQNDALIKAFTDMGDFGGSVGLTTGKLLEMTLKAGYFSGNIDIITKNAGRLNTNLRGLGDTLQEGLATFTGMISLTQDQRDQYMRLGWSQEKVTGAQTDFVKTMVTSSMSLAKTPEALRIQSLKYIDAMIELQTLTGMNSDQLRQGQEAAAGHLAWQTANAKIARKIDAERAVAADETGKYDEDRKKLAAKNVASMEAEQNTRLMATSELGRLLGANSKEFGSMLLSLANDGKLLTDYTATTGNIIMRATMRVLKGYDNIGNIADAGKRQEAVISKLFETVRLMMPEGAGEIFAGNLQLMQNAVVQNQRLSFEEAATRNRNLIALQMSGKSEDDARVKALTKMNAVELAAHQAMDAFANMLSGPVTNAFTMLMEGMQSFGYTMGKLVKSLWFPGADKAGQDIMDMFSTEESLNAKIQKVNAEIAEIKKPTTSSLMGMHATQGFNGMAADKIRIEKLEEEKARLESSKKRKNPNAQSHETAVEQARYNDIEARGRAAITEFREKNGMNKKGFAERTDQEALEINKKMAELQEKNTKLLQGQYDILKAQLDQDKKVAEEAKLTADRALLSQADERKKTEQNILSLNPPIPGPLPGTGKFVVGENAGSGAITPLENTFLQALGSSGFSGKVTAMDDSATFKGHQGENDPHKRGAVDLAITDEMWAANGVAKPTLEDIKKGKNALSDAQKRVIDQFEADMKKVAEANGYRIVLNEWYKLSEGGTGGHLHTEPIRRPMTQEEATKTMPAPSPGVIMSQTPQTPVAPVVAPTATSPVTTVPWPPTPPPSQAQKPSGTGAATPDEKKVQNAAAPISDKAVMAMLSTLEKIHDTVQATNDLQREIYQQSMA
jgi:hypothetical protein